MWVIFSFRTEAEEPNETVHGDEITKEKAVESQGHYEADVSMDVVPSPPPSSRVYYPL